jgi:hypothetical protein
MCPQTARAADMVQLLDHAGGSSYFRDVLRSDLVSGLDDGNCTETKMSFAAANLIIEDETLAARVRRVRMYSPRFDLLQYGIALIDAPGVAYDPVTSRREMAQQVIGECTHVICVCHQSDQKLDPDVLHFLKHRNVFYVSTHAENNTSNLASQYSREYRGEKSTYFFCWVIC